jgi:hypothetical protein
MRRVLLVLSVISFAGWSQPAQPQAQAPIVVQIQTPPANPWMRVVELVVPGIIGAGLALFGVWLTNRYNAATNRANQQHDLEKLNRSRTRLPHTPRVGIIGGRFGKMFTSRF